MPIDREGAWRIHRGRQQRRSRLYVLCDSADLRLTKRLRIRRWTPGPTQMALAEDSLGYRGRRLGLRRRLPGGRGRALGTAGELHGREGELDAVGVERFLDERIGFAADDELLARFGHHLHAELNGVVAELLDALHLQRLDDVGRVFGIGGQIL